MKKIAIDIRSVYPIISTQAGINIGDLIELYQEKGVLLYSSLSEKGTETIPPMVIEGEVELIDSAKLTKEELNKILKKQKNTQ